MACFFFCKNLFFTAFIFVAAFAEEEYTRDYITPNITLDGSENKAYQIHPCVTNER